MVSTFVVAVALAIGADEPVPPLPQPYVSADPKRFADGPSDAFKVPGPYFKVPCTVHRPDEVELVQVYVSDTQGKKWELVRELTPDKDSFTFGAKRPGEYWFATRLKDKAGQFEPAETQDLIPELRVQVATGTNAPIAPAKPNIADTVKELDDELTRAELDLIRREIKNLMQATDLSPMTEERIDRLRARLKQARERLSNDQIRRSNLDRTLFPPAGAPEPAARDNDLIPPQILPVTPIPVPARPVAPMPRAPERP